MQRSALLQIIGCTGSGVTLSVPIVPPLTTLETTDLYSRSSTGVECDLHKIFPLTAGHPWQCTTTGYKDKTYGLAEINSTGVRTAWPRSIRRVCPQLVGDQFLQCAYGLLEIDQCTESALRATSLREVEVSISALNKKDRPKCYRAFGKLRSEAPNCKLVRANIDHIGCSVRL